MSIMTLDEAIKHLKEKIDNQSGKCKKEHEQLLAFLLELKIRREESESLRRLVASFK